nr:GLUG motif-containing protein [Candidatus Hydrogenedentota bacterium]
YNVVISTENAVVSGFFGWCGAGSSIKNLGLVNIYLSSIDDEYFESAVSGSLVGANEGVISDCYETGSVTTMLTGDGDVQGNTGGLVGYNSGTITACFGMGSVTATAINFDDPSVYLAVGGLVGQNGGTISDCYATGAVEGLSSDLVYAGGLVGWNSFAIIRTCYATSSVKVAGYEEVNAGGLVGDNFNSTISNCYAMGVVEASGNDGVYAEVYAGGLVGFNSSTITACYAMGAVAAMSCNEAGAGGLVGFNYGEISTCYATGAATATGDEAEEYVGGLLAYNWGSGAVMDSFWDVIKSGINMSAGGVGAVGLETAIMLQQSTFVNVGWDFTAVWSITPDVTYPWLQALDYTDTGYPMP